MTAAWKTRDVTMHTACRAYRDGWAGLLTHLLDLILRRPRAELAFRIHHRGPVEIARAELTFR